LQFITKVLQSIVFIRIKFVYPGRTACPCLVRVYKLAKIFTICVSVQKVPVARLAKPPKTEFILVNDYFGGKHNTANGTLWTDTIYRGNSSRVIGTCFFM
jgi:hypothetical protein